MPRNRCTRLIAAHCRRATAFVAARASGPQPCACGRSPPASRAIRRKPARIVQVTMSEGDGKMMFIPDRVEIKRGEQIKFMLRNNGELDHEFMLATHRGECEARRGDEEKSRHGARRSERQARSQPKKTSEIVWKFTKAGAVRIWLPDSRPPRSRHDRHDHREVKRSEKGEFQCERLHLSPPCAARPVDDARRDIANPQWPTAQVTKIDALGRQDHDQARADQEASTWTTA